MKSSKRFVPSATLAVIPIIFLGSICCFFALMFGPLVDYRDSPLRLNLSSRKNRDLAAAAFALSIPILMEIIIKTASAFSANRKSRKVEEHMREALLSPAELFLLISAILSCHVTAFLPSETPNLMNIFYCAKRCRTSLMGGGIVISFCRYDAKFWSVRTSTVILFLNISSNIVASLHDNISHLHGNDAIKMMSTVAFYVAMFVFYANTLRWFISITPTLIQMMKICRRPEVNTISETRDAIHAGYYFYPYVYVVATSVTYLVILIVIKIYPEFGLNDSNGIAFHNLAITVYLFLIIYISDRVMKYEIIQGLYALIESKKTYVRYISHELRTPLNTAFLGLKIVCDDLKTSALYENSENLETLLDVQSACHTSVEILNDLLCFDKLESGILELHKHDVTLIPFIDDCVNMFASQARDAGVTITCVTSAPVRLGVDLSTPTVSTTPCTATGLLDDDFVHMDKFKMDQVLRNLTSNALKFTPRGGSVTVCATFVPNDGCQGPPASMHPVSVSDDTHSVLNLPRLWSFLTGPVRCCVSIFACRSRRNRVQSSTKGDLNITNPGENQRCHRPSVLVNEIQSLCQEDASSYGYVRGASATASPKLNTAMKADIETGRRGWSNDAAIGAANGLDRDGGNGAEDLRTNGRLRIVVTDTGAGISQENQLRLFKEIVQFNPEVLQAGGGSGLGLWITSSIVKMHGGSISVHSEGVGRGSSFTVEIDMHRSVSVPHPPLVRQSLYTRHGSYDLEGSVVSEEKSPCMISTRTSESHAVSASHRSVSTSPVALPHLSTEYARHLMIEDMDRFSYASPTINSSLSILVVDDSSLNRKLLCKLLCAAGYTCEEASDGLIAVEMVRRRMSDWAGSREEYRAILMDFVMPNMDGPTATKEIRGLGYRGPIFGVTGNAMNSDVNYFVGSGADGVLAKPFDFSMFKELLSLETA